MKDLKGATIKYCHLVMWNETFIGLSGQAWVGYHNSAVVKPASISYTSGVVRRKWNRTRWPRGTRQTLDLGVFYGNLLKAGTSKGIIVGPIGSNDLDLWGYFYGASSSRRPYLVVQYTK
jgi:hypothetical protein